MRRREFITLVGGAVAAWPLAGHAQQRALPVVGILASCGQWPPQYETNFRRGLIDGGYVNGQNVTIEYRWAEGHYDRLSGLAAELVRQRVAVIFASGGSLPGLAAKVATTEIPIVFDTGGDPVSAGLVTSVSHPDGNVTGLALIFVRLTKKRVDLLHQLVPDTLTIGALVNPNYADVGLQRRELQEAAESFGRRIQIVDAGTPAEIDAAFATLVERKAGALIVANDPFLVSRGDQVVALTARYAIPAIFSQRDFVEVGGLMCYGPNFLKALRQAGVYVSKILNGAKPTDLPVIQPAILETVINLKTAKALGLTVPPSLLAQADEVIE
jgi:putative tryptophan/tyrosine transport system substrate-binding protein